MGFGKWFRRFFGGSSRNTPDAEDEETQLALAISASLAEEDESRRRQGSQAHETVTQEDEQPYGAQLEDEYERPKTESSLRETGKGKPEVEDDEPPRSHQRQPDDERLPRTACGCETELRHEAFVSFAGSVWHRCCFRCRACCKRIDLDKDECELSRCWLYHKSCHEELKSLCKEDRGGSCIVCNKRFVQGTKFKFHPFWKRPYCLSHEEDGTASCCSCERLEPRGSTYLMHKDGRRLCYECLESATMDTDEAQGLYFELREFFEGLNMKVEQVFPLLLVEKQALNDNIEGKNCNVEEVQGLCLSESRPISVVCDGRERDGNKFLSPRTEHQIPPRECEVTAILILYGLPRLLTGSILAHELMHAWFRLHGLSGLSPVVEEGMCQVVAHMWLESKTFTSPADHEGSSSSSSSSVAPKKDAEELEFDKKLLEFFKYSIETNSSQAYGDGFREGFNAVEKHTLKPTLHNISKTGNFPTT